MQLCGQEGPLPLQVLYTIEIKGKKDRCMFQSVFTVSRLSLGDSLSFLFAVLFLVFFPSADPADQ